MALDVIVVRVEMNPTETETEKIFTSANIVVTRHP